TGEARNDALGDRTEPRLHEASDVGYDSVFKCPIEVRGITAIVANDNDRPVRPAIAHAVEANLRTRGGCHFGALGRLVCSPKSLRPASVLPLGVGAVSCVDICGERPWRNHPPKHPSSKHTGNPAARAASG